MRNLFRLSGTGRRLTLGGIAAVAVIASSSIATAAPAAADGYVAGWYADCADSYVCVWKDSHFYTAGAQNHYLRTATYLAHFGSHDYSGTSYNAGDSASSSFNAGLYNDPATVFQNSQCGGYAYTMQAGGGDSDYSNDSPESGGAFNDQASSMAFSEFYSACHTG
jgi:hypothetical protein